MKLFPDAVPANIDANRIYEQSLKAIKDAVGGHYYIGALTDFVGEIELTESAHPYWSSVRASGDIYWSRVNNLIKSKVKVSATTLDTLVETLALKPPFLLKLDIQGAEKAALTGGKAALQKCLVVICEADIDDFRDLNTVLTDAGFQLYDITTLSRIKDGTLGWFYPVYINQKLEDMFPRAFWDERDNDAVIGSQIARREQILRSNQKILSRLQFGQQSVRRNELCPCGSGRKVKHCCGSHEP
jgi:FkbM family methyltransferase